MDNLNPCPSPSPPRPDVRIIPLPNQQSCFLSNLKKSPSLGKSNRRSRLGMTYCPKECLVDGCV